MSPYLASRVCDDQVDGPAQVALIAWGVCYLVSVDYLQVWSLVYPVPEEVSLCVSLAG